MKANIIKGLHLVGVYRDPKSKQKLESMKLTEILEVWNWVEEEMEKGTEFKKFEWDYEMVKPTTKKDKVLNKNKKKR